MQIKREYSIDVIRGLVMVIMALDHVRDLMHTSSLTQSPTDLNTTTPALFFTRWITHLCAPTFVFLSGISAYISMINRDDLGATRKFLLSRGIWLIVLEFTLVNFGVWFDIKFGVFVFGVLAAIGFGFIILSFLLKYTVRTIGIVGLCIVFIHNIFALLPGLGAVKTILSPLFAPGAFPIGQERMFVMGYPPIPWLGILLIGFSAGKIYIDRKAAHQRKLVLKAGMVSLALFLLLRFINLYGDNSPWLPQKNNLYTFLSFINVTKYPPSLQFSLLFLGLMFLTLALLHSIKNKWTEILSVYGRVPLFYFLIHWYLIHPILFLIILLQGYRSSEMEFGFNFGRPKGGGGVELWAVYLIWLGVVVVLYPVCKWFGRYKAQHKEKKWLRFL
jgi:uncharacterized membrane protein